MAGGDQGTDPEKALWPCAWAVWSAWLPALREAQALERVGVGGLQAAAWGQVTHCE